MPIIEKYFDFLLDPSSAPKHVQEAYRRIQATPGGEEKLQEMVIREGLKEVGIDLREARRAQKKRKIRRGVGSY